MAAYKSAGAGTISAGAVTTTEILDATIATADLADKAVTLAKMADIATDKLIGRDTAGTGVPEALTVSGGLEFSGSTGIQRSALTGDVTATAGSNTTAIAALAVTTGALAAGAVTYAKIQNVTATSRLLGRATAGAGSTEELTAAGGLEFTAGGIQRSALTGDVTASAGSNTTAIAANAVVTAAILDANVTRAKLSNGTALSVIGRSANSGGVPADIVATAATDAVLRESGSTVGFGTIATAGIANNAVTVGKLAQLAGMSVIGRSTNSTGDPAAITAVTSGHVLTCVGGTSVAFAAPAAGTTDINGMTATVTPKVLTDYLPEYNGAATANRKILLADMMVARNVLRLYDECTSLTGANGWTRAAATLGTSDATHTGVVTLTTSSVTVPGQITNNQTDGAWIQLGGGQWRFVCSLKTPSTLADITNNYYVWFGIGDGNSSNGVGNSTQWSHGCAWQYNYTVNSGKWEFITVNAGSATFDSSTTITTSTWYTLEFVVNAAGTSITPYLNGTAGTPVATNIPTSTLLNAGAGIIKLAGANRSIDVDYVDVIWEPTTAR